MSHPTRSRPFPSSRGKSLKLGKMSFAALRLTALTALTAPHVLAEDYWWRGNLNNQWASTVEVSGNIVSTNFTTDASAAVTHTSLPGQADVVRFATPNASFLNNVFPVTDFSIAGLTTEIELPANVTINNNILTLGDIGIVANSPRTLTIASRVTTNEPNLLVDSAHATSVVNLNSIINGNFGIRKSGPGTLALLRPNGYTGATTVTEGILTVTVTNALPANTPLTIGQPDTATKAVFLSDGLSQTISSLTLYARPDINSRIPISFGIGTLRLNGNLSLLDTQDNPGNNFGAIIQASPFGSLNLGNAVRTFTIAGQNRAQDELTIEAPITNGGIILNANPSSFNGVTSGMLLGATAPNSYTGGTTVNAGILTVQPTTTLGTGTLTLNTTDGVESGVVLNNPSQTLTLLRTGSVSSGPATLVLNNGCAVTVVQAANSTFEGAISGTGSLTKNVGGNLTLAGSAPSTYTGGTTVNAGTITVGASTTLGPGPLTLSTLPENESRVIFNNPAQTLTSLRTTAISSPATITLNNECALTVNQSTNTTYSGFITGTGSLIKSGTGTLALARANTYTGGTTVTEGNLNALAASAIPANTPVTIGQSTAANTANLNTNGFAQTLSGITLYARSLAGSTTGINVGTGPLTLNGSLALLDAEDAPGNNYGATIQASTGGTLNLGGDVRNFDLAGQNVNGAELVINAVITNGGINLTATPSVYDGTPAGMILAANSANTYTGGTTVNAGILTVRPSTTLGVGPLTLNTTGDVESQVIFSNAAQTLASLQTGTLDTGPAGLLLDTPCVLTINQAATTTFAGTISGGGRLIKSGPGTLTLAGSASHTGGTSIAQGTLQIGDGGATGSVAGNITNNASLVFNRSDDFTHTGNIFGSGTLTKTGPGTLTLTGSNASTNVFLEDGVLAVSSSASLGQPNGTLSSGFGGAGTLRILGTGFTTTSRSIAWGELGGTVDIDSAENAFTLAQSFSFLLTKSGPGTLVLTGTSVLDQLTITQGTLQIGDGGATGSILGNITNDASLVINRSADLTLPGRITGTGTLTKLGSSLLTLAPDQSLPHIQSDLQIAEGTLDLTNNSLLIDYADTSIIAVLIGYLNAGSLTAHADFQGLPTTLAISEAADLGVAEFNGIAVDDTTVIAKYTYVGDANLDGQVDALDYERVDLAIGNTGVFGTAQGDLNYDGTVDALDYEQIDLNIGNGVGAPLSPIFIPEPTLVAPLAIAALAARRRR